MEDDINYYSIDSNGIMAERITKFCSFHDSLKPPEKVNNDIECTFDLIPELASLDVETYILRVEKS